MNKEDKYGDDEKFESWADVKLFFPIASKMLDPIYNLGLTPNMVTLLSTLFTLTAIYYFSINQKKYAILAYMIGYLLDCVDGKLARKYSMGSNIGMALDMVSDNVSNLALFLFIIYTKQLCGTNLVLIILIGFFSLMLSISYGLNEAIASYEATGSDNFYERRLKQLEESKKIADLNEVLLYNLFLGINKATYKTYKSIFPVYNKDRIDSWFDLLKNFGPGNYCLFISFILYYI
jgi:hypothetical protein